MDLYKFLDANGIRLKVERSPEDEGLAASCTAYLESEGGTWIVIGANPSMQACGEGKTLVAAIRNMMAIISGSKLQLIDSPVCLSRLIKVPPGLYCYDF